jgi:hypothetical protein
VSKRLTRRARDERVAPALAAAVLFASSAPLAKGLPREASPQLLAGLLYLGSGTGFIRPKARYRCLGSQDPNGRPR